MAEKEYIERGEALDALLIEMSGTGYQSRAMDAVRFVTAADVVEVVRCKDCKHYKAVVSTCGNCYRTTCIQHTEDFCSYGERKEQK